MDRDSSEKATATLGTRPNGRFTAPLIINTPSQRKSLFVPAKSDENAPLAYDSEESAKNRVPSAKPNSSITSSDALLTSPPSTKIPRPATQANSARQQRPFSLTDAFRVAEREEEEAIFQASPSPAPRSWRVNREKPERKPKSTGHASPIPEPSLEKSPSIGLDETDNSVKNFKPASRRDDVPGLRTGLKPPQHTREQSEQVALTVPSGDLFSKTRLGPKVVETGREPVRRASNSSLKGKSPARSLDTRSTKPSHTPSGIRARKSSSPANPEQATRDAAILSVVDTPGIPKPIAITAITQSPNKSFAWQADADFTAGDVQVSTSPPVTLSLHCRSNTKIDEIRAREAEVRALYGSSESPKSRLRNTKIDEIRALEAKTELKYAYEPPGQDVDPELKFRGNIVGSESAEIDWHSPQSDTKGDEKRAREIESLSRKALATARLDEIRERNGGYRANPSSDTRYISTRNPLRDPSPSHDKPPRLGPQDGLRSIRESPTSQDDSQELLRRLARATSSSPGPGRIASSVQHTKSEPIKAKNSEISRGDARPTVGFAGLKREPSVESNLSNLPQRPHSDSDPTDRIEGEMKLFAPREDYSEKGSLRAPSPELEEKYKEEIVDETPKPLKLDPLSQPTPQVTGVCVDTPAPSKVIDEPRGTLIPLLVEPNVNPDGQFREATAAVVRQKKADDSAGHVVSGPLIRERGTNLGVRNTRHALPTNGDRVSGRALLVSGHRRARSQPRARSPLVNSVRPPTVKDDLLAIHNSNQVEDSTLDDLEDLLGSQEARLFDSQEQEKVQLGGFKVKENIGDNFLKELEAYDRMNKSLTTGLLGIRTAKQGIERLEDRVARVDPRLLAAQTTPLNNKITYDTHLASFSESTNTFVSVPLPRLWRRDPALRLTFVGIGVFVILLWSIVESAMCFIYCKPAACGLGQPCRWAHDDPSWGSSIPVKLDQWTTGGRTRNFLHQIRPDVADWVADIWDATTGTDFTKLDISAYEWGRKQQHRRRLARKGLVQVFTEQPEDRPRYEAWNAARLAQERVDSARQMGFEIEDESMAGDEKV